MLYKNRPKKIYLHLGIVDFRKQLNGLAQIIDSEFPKGRLNDCWFIFISRNNKQVKLIYWRNSGLCLWQYRLDSESFKVRKPRLESNKSISWKDLQRFLDGFNIFEGEAHLTKKPKRYS